MDNLVLLFLSPQMLVFILVILYFYGIGSSIKTIYDANQKKTLTDAETKEKETAVILLSCLIGIPFVICVLYVLYQKYSS